MFLGKSHAFLTFLILKHSNATIVSAMGLREHDSGCPGARFIVLGARFDGLPGSTTQHYLPGCPGARFAISFFLDDLSYRFLRHLSQLKCDFRWILANGCPKWRAPTIFCICLMEKCSLSNVFREVKCFFNIFHSETLKRYYTKRKMHLGRSNATIVSANALTFSQKIYLIGS